jgi:hypothetical protein
MPSPEVFDSDMICKSYHYQVFQPELLATDVHLAPGVR